MEQFVAVSKEAKNAVHMANIASTMPVNVIITGPKGVGKKLLAKIVNANAKGYFAKDFFALVKEQRVDLNEYDAVILYNLDELSNSVQFIDTLFEYDIKVIATSDRFIPAYLEKFLVKIEIPPLSEREDDVEYLIKHFLKDAKQTLFLDESIDEKNLHIDLAQNGISLKESIYKSLLFNNLSKSQVMDILQKFIYKEFETSSDYKDLLEIFEVPLLLAAKQKYKSQLQISKMLQINRVTLRKKLAKYEIE
jgi:DNA-binding NtrC family response regulator